MLESIGNFCLASATHKCFVPNTEIPEFCKCSKVLDDGTVEKSYYFQEPELVTPSSYLYTEIGMTPVKVKSLYCHK